MAVSSIGDTYFFNYSTEANDAVSENDKPDSGCRDG